MIFTGPLGRTFRTDRAMQYNNFYIQVPPVMVTGTTNDFPYRTSNKGNLQLSRSLIER